MAGGLGCGAPADARGLSEFLDEVQVALDEIHHQIDQTYFRPTFEGWQPQSAATVTWSVA